MAYKIAATAATLNDREHHSSVAGFFKCNPSNSCAAFTRFQLTVCSHGSSALAELLVIAASLITIMQEKLRGVLLCN